VYEIQNFSGPARFLTDMHYFSGMKKSTTTLIALFFSIALKAQSSTARINHVAIYVVDLAKSTAFYRDIIGLDSIPEPFHDGKHTWLSICPGASLHIIAGAEQPRNYYKNNHICFSVPSVESFTKLLREKGIDWEDVSGKKGGITIRVDKVKQIWLNDPDGYWLEVNDARD
jgi:lactoylglutathione lyase